MPKSQIDSAALLAATIAGALALLILPGQFAWLSSIGGLTLLLVLFAYDQEGYRTMFQSLAFAAVAGFAPCSLRPLCSGCRQDQGAISPADRQVWSKWLPAVWAGVTLIVWALIGLAWAAARLWPLNRRECAFQPSEASSRSSCHPQLRRRRLFRSAAREHLRSPTCSSCSGPLSCTPAHFRTRAYLRRPSRLRSRTAATSAPASPPPGAIPLPPRVGKETMIYVTLMGEGLNVLRSVRAEHLGRDFYRIIDAMPEGETWQFESGQVVRCKKKNLSSGKALVAIEEAPRAS